MNGESDGRGRKRHLNMGGDIATGKNHCQPIFARGKNFFGVTFGEALIEE
jgi:hypothetical protein